MAFNKYNYMIDDTFVDINAIKQTAALADNCGYYFIPLKYEFRPDLIAYYLYQDVSMAEYLAIINDIDNTPDGFYRGRKIRYLLPAYKENL